MLRRSNTLRPQAGRIRMCSSSPHSVASVCLHRCTQTRAKNYPIIQLQSPMTGNGQCWLISIAHHVRQTKKPKCLMLRGEWGVFCLLDCLYSPSLICVTKHLRSFVGESEKKCQFYRTIKTSEIMMCFLIACFLSVKNV